MNVNEHYKFVNIPLPYGYNALEPYIDEKTMYLHHDRHLQTYIDNLNKTLAQYPKLQRSSLEELIYLAKSLPDEIRVPVERNAGGVYNHFFFFDSMSPAKNQHPLKRTAELINNKYYSFGNFKAIFKEKALSVFGSGYSWLVLNNKIEPDIITTANQFTPLTENLYPLLTVDVWEHAYYLKHYNLRSDYIDNWFNVVNWQKVEDRITAATNRPPIQPYR